LTLGTIIQTKRQQLGLSQEQLAEQVGVSRQAVSKWEVGDAIPDTDKLVPLARALGITVDELLGNDAQPKTYTYTYTAAAETDAPAPEKKPGWLATHWYWVGLVPVVWGVWQLLWLIVVIFSMAAVGDVQTSFGGALKMW